MTIFGTHRTNIICAMSILYTKYKMNMGALKVHGVKIVHVGKF